MKTLSLNILDIVQNSIRAKADEISVEIRESEPDDLYSITITDNGTGIPESLIKNVTDPFITTRTRRRMGLGLSLLKYHAELTGGYLNIESCEGKGTVVKAIFSLRHIDRQPLGDITGVLKILIASNPAINFKYFHHTDKGEYHFNTAETKEYLEVDTLYDNSLLDDIRKMIAENLKELEASGVYFETTG
jgi:DNA mismatch repair ATPase MutL